MLDVIRPVPATSRLDLELLALSGLVDEAQYRNRAGLAGDADAVAHYLEQGWLQGLDPHAGFDGGFLRPYYEAAGRYGPPALTWRPPRRSAPEHADSSAPARTKATAGSRGQSQRGGLVRGDRGSGGRGRDRGIAVARSKPW